MHIANFTNTYLPVISGVVRSIRSFRDELTHQGHNVFIFAQEQMDYVDKDPFIFRYPSLNLPTGIDIPAAVPISSFIDRLIRCQAGCHPYASPIPAWANRRNKSAGI